MMESLDAWRAKLKNKKFVRNAMVAVAPREPPAWTAEVHPRDNPTWTALPQLQPGPEGSEDEEDRAGRPWKASKPPKAVGRDALPPACPQPIRIMVRSKAVSAGGAPPQPQEEMGAYTPLADGHAPAWHRPAPGASSGHEDLRARRDDTVQRPAGGYGNGLRDDVLEPARPRSARSSAIQDSYDRPVPCKDGPFSGPRRLLASLSIGRKVKPVSTSAAQMQPTSPKSRPSSAPVRESSWTTQQPSSHADPPMQLLDQRASGGAPRPPLHPAAQPSSLGRGLAYAATHSAAQQLKNSASVQLHPAAQPGSVGRGLAYAATHSATPLWAVNEQGQSGRSSARELSDWRVAPPATPPPQSTAGLHQGRELPTSPARNRVETFGGGNGDDPRETDGDTYTSGVTTTRTQTDRWTGTGGGSDAAEAQGAVPFTTWTGQASDVMAASSAGMAGAGPRRLQQGASRNARTSLPGVS